MCDVTREGVACQRYELTSTLINRYKGRNNKGLKWELRAFKELVFGWSFTSEPVSTCLGFFMSPGGTNGVFLLFFRVLYEGLCVFGTYEAAEEASEAL